MFYFGDFIKKGGGKMDEIIIVKGLSKRYGDFIALNNVNINLSKGIYAFLGLNGAGKTTFINLLTDNISRTDGEILYNGTEIKNCLLYTSPSPRDRQKSRMPSSA